MGRTKYMSDYSKGIKRFQVFGNKEYHLAFDTKRKARKYIKSQSKNIKFKIKQSWL